MCVLAEARGASSSAGSPRGAANKRDSQTHPGDQLPPGKAGKGGPGTLSGATEETVPSPATATETKYKSCCFRSRYIDIKTLTDLVLNS